MRIGIVGYGVVGKAISKGFKNLGHEVLIHDIKLQTKLDDLINVEIIYICVPSPSTNKGKCDTRIVEKCVEDLNYIDFNGIIAIKSTVEPGTTEKLIKKFKKLQICFVPEFLRERCAAEDFIKNHDLLAIGSTSRKIITKIKKSHGSYPKKVSILSPSEAEILKYFSNSFNAMKIIFANNFYEICQHKNANYDLILNTFIKKELNPKDYLSVNKNLRGYGGVCLPKDVKALKHLAKELKMSLKIFDAIDKDNKYLKTTVFKGMRD